MEGKTSISCEQTALIWFTHNIAQQAIKCALIQITAGCRLLASDTILGYKDCHSAIFLWSHLPISFRHPLFSGKKW